MGKIRIVAPGKTPGYPYPVCKNISIFHGCMVWIEKSLTRVTDWHHEACRVMLNSILSDGFFYPHHTHMIDTFSRILSIYHIRF